jgi:hypothetical protein
MITYRNVEDLRRVGIKLRSSATHAPIHINFCDGWFAARLTLPKIVVDNTTVLKYLNLIA